MIQATEDIYDLRDKVYLTDLEIWKIKYYTEKLTSYDKSKEIANLKLQLIEAQKTLISYKVLEDRKQHEKITKEHTELLKSISKTHNIPDGIRWSYNKETNEIMIDDENV